MSTISNLTPICIPSFDEAVDESFAKHVASQLLNFYTPLDGRYAQYHLTDFGDNTTLYMNVGETLHELSTEGLPKEDWTESDAMTSVKFVTHIPLIMKLLAEQLPARLDPINWSCTEITPSFYNSKQFRGKDKDTGEALYGAPACLFILKLKPIPGKVTVCKARAPAQAARTVSAPPAAPAATSDGFQVASSKGTKAYLKAAQTVADAPPPSGGGGGAGPYKGKRK